jgi:tRNA uridine 5-carboxymethylaminomethyl modification enzyme
MTQYDVLVIGGGHAGVEAALAAARMGANTLLITHNIETIGQMSCNPAIGGIGKGHLVKEIDAMGGAMGQAIDQAGIHFKILNQSNGHAVRATRAQADRALYKQAIRNIVEQQANLELFQQAVASLIVENQCVLGVITEGKIQILAKTVVLTAGTFLAGTIHVGNIHYPGGRAGDAAATSLAANLKHFPIRMGRLKTGTPPRLDRRSINFANLELQAGESLDGLLAPKFSYWHNTPQYAPQISCYITHTNATTHAIVQENLALSAMYGGHISGTGPRYCPSIEDKIVKFAHHSSHQIFLEPEGLNSNEIYPNGLSTSLPFAVQLQLVRSIAGLEQAHITRPGYAIEYDFFDPRDLQGSLESKYLQHLFFAGQINGTTGYEEAAAQGLVAGINAACKAAGRAPWLPSRTNSYIGVMLDDLVLHGTTEPYRMFTSRSEYRLSLREDNAAERLTPTAISLGLLSSGQIAHFEAQQTLKHQWQQRLAGLLLPANSQTNQVLTSLGSSAIQQPCKLLELLKRPQLHWQPLLAVAASELEINTNDAYVLEEIYIALRYAGYVERQAKEIKKLSALEQILLPTSLNYAHIEGLSAELREKLHNARPTSLAQAQRIPGITPAAILLLQVYLKKHYAISVAGEPCDNV